MPDRDGAVIQLHAGDRVGPYQIVELVGIGGMGEVYKARDTRLNRPVALKVLRQHLRDDPELKQRFEREAQTVAALQHPHICVLHDIGHHGDLDFLVMEYLEGVSLARRLRRGPLPLEQALRCAIEIGDALDKAHRKGVVHRDLKPGNIMLTRSGTKLLDFGLVKLRPHGVPAVPGTSATTETGPLTEEGAVLGTLPYMAPEQLEGRETDARTDIFAFGATAYEMVTGRRAFEGTSQAGLIAAILEREPAPMATGEMSPALERVIRKCLEKDPEARWQSAGDMTDALRLLGASSVAGSRPLPTRSQRAARRGWWLAAAAVALIGIAIAAPWLWPRGRPAQRPLVPARHEQITFTGNVQSAAVSPDGRMVAYAVLDPAGTTTRVLVRDITSGQPLEVWGGSRLTDLRWMPNGSQLVIGTRTSGIETWVVPRLGGSARRLDESGTYVAVSPDESEVALAGPNLYTPEGFPGFRIAPVGGGQGRSVRLTGIRWMYGLDWSPPTNRLVVSSLTLDDRYVVWTVRPDGQEQRRIYEGPVQPGALCASPVADVVYLFEEQRLLRLPLTGKRSAARDVLVSGLPPSGEFACSVSGDGERLVHVRRLEFANLWRVDLDKKSTQPTPLTQGTSVYGAPRVSPDGQWIAFSLRGQMWKMPVAGGQPILLAEGSSPVWSPDGRQLAFTSMRGTPRVWVAAADGRQAVAIEGAGGGNNLVTWLPDGRLAWQTPDAQNYRIRNLRTGREELLVKDPSVGWVFDPEFSPSGDQVAVFYNRKDRTASLFNFVLGRGLWTLSWPAREERFLAPELSPAGWSPDGQWIYALATSGHPAIVRVSARTGTVEPVGTIPVGSPRPWGELGGCDVTPDGRAVVCSVGAVNADAWQIEGFDPQTTRAGH
jgi:Tol biopolymer transport system component